MNIPILDRIIDERFLEHRRRSLSAGGLLGGLVAIALFEYRHFVSGVWNWDLLIVALTIAGVKVAVMTWHLFNE